MNTYRRIGRYGILASLISGLWLLPHEWFYGGRDRFKENPVLNKVTAELSPP